MYSRPPEWRKNKTICLAWPYDQSLWTHNLKPAQDEFVGLIRALDGESVLILVPSDHELACVQELLKFAPQLSYKIISYGDIWLRDTMPIWLIDHKGEIGVLCPKFNGWGHKYLFEYDQDLRARMVRDFKLKAISSDLVLEGGAIECDGAGYLMTTEQCLLNANRHPGLSKAEIESELRAKLGVEKIIWLKTGLINDHTDGHIDTIARFIGEKTVAIMLANTPSDPNAQVLLDIKLQLAREFRLLELPSPGMILSDQGEIMPASYLNFIIGDQVVVMPSYDSPYDQAAEDILSSYFKMPVRSCSAKAILSGGGAFHCMSQEIFN